MKVPLVYPKMTDSTNCPLKKCYAFEKIDGTNIHWCWNERDHFYAFGTRRDRFPLTEDGIHEFNKAHPGLEEVATSFLDDDMAERLDRLSWAGKEVIVFTEFHGPYSFAGQHRKEDQKLHYLLDVQVDGQLMGPEQFLNDFKDFVVYIPAIVYKGKFTGDFVERVRKGKYAVDEGVVIKGTVNGEVYMCKVKTDAYMEKLKEKFKSKWKDYWE